MGERCEWGSLIFGSPCEASAYTALLWGGKPDFPLCMEHFEQYQLQQDNELTQLRSALQRLITASYISPDINKDEIISARGDALQVLHNRAPAVTLAEHDKAVRSSFVTWLRNQAGMTLRMSAAGGYTYPITKMLERYESEQ